MVYAVQNRRLSRLLYYLHKGWIKRVDVPDTLTAAENDLTDEVGDDPAVYDTEYNSEILYNPYVICKILQITWSIEL